MIICGSKQAVSDPKCFIRTDLEKCRNVTHETLVGKVGHYKKIFITSLYTCKDNGTKVTDVFSSEDYQILLTKLLFASLGSKDDLSQTFCLAYQCNLFTEDYRVLTFKNKTFWDAIIENDLPDVQYFEAFLLYLSCSSKKTQYFDRTIKPSKFVDIFKRLLDLEKKGISSKITSFSIDYSLFFREKPSLQLCYDKCANNTPVAVLCYILTSSLLVESFSKVYLTTDHGIKIIFDVLDTQSCSFIFPVVVHILLKTLEEAFLDCVISQIENLLQHYDFKRILTLTSSSDKLVRQYAQSVIQKTCDSKIFYEEKDKIKFPAWTELTDISPSDLEKLSNLETHDQAFCFDLISYVYRLGVASNKTELAKKFFPKSMEFLYNFSNIYAESAQDDTFAELVLAHIKTVVHMNLATEVFAVGEKAEVLQALIPFLSCCKTTQFIYDLAGVNETALWGCSQIASQDSDCILLLYKRINFNLLVEETKKLCKDFITQTIHPQNCSQILYTNFEILNSMLRVNEFLKYTPVSGSNPFTLTPEIVKTLCSICSTCIELPFLMDAVGRQSIFTLAMIIQENQSLVKELIKIEILDIIKGLFLAYNPSEFPYLVKCRLMFKYHYPEQCWVSFYGFDELCEENEDGKSTVEIPIGNKYLFDKQCSWLECSKEIKTTMKCGVCKKTYYCSTNCQLNDWPTHRLSCKRIRKWSESTT